MSLKEINNKNAGGMYIKWSKQTQDIQSPRVWSCTKTGHNKKKSRQQQQRERRITNKQTITTHNLYRTKQNDRKKWQKATRTRTKAQAMDIIEKDNKSIKLQQRNNIYTPKKDFKQQKQQEEKVMHQQNILPGN